MKILATQTIKALGMIQGQSYDLDISDEDKEKLISKGFITEVEGDNFARPVHLWEEKSYKKDTLMLKDAKFYVSNTDTSDTWVTSEWDLLT